MKKGATFLLLAILLFSPCLGYCANRQINCLARNVYFEAGNQSREGMIAVAWVAMNRLHRHFGHDICEIVNNPDEYNTYLYKGNPHGIAWHQAEFSAEQVYHHQVNDPTHGAVFYHADYVHRLKHWWKTRIETIKIGNHLFFK